MNTTDKKELIGLLQANYKNLTQQEKQKLFLLLNSEKGNNEIETQLNTEWEQFTFDKELSVGSARMLYEIRKRIEKRKSFPNFRNTFFQYFPYTAAVLLIGIAIVGLQFYTIKPRQGNDVGVYYEYQALTRKPKKVDLPDGSKILLFPGSSLVIPENFELAENRNAKLDGEAFFEIAPDTVHPFVLDMGGIGLEVVGTSFNISNYSDDTHINVALKTGKVKLFQGRWNTNSEKIPLEPGYLASYVRGEDGFKIEKTDLRQYTSWIDGVLIFRDNPMKDVFRKLERWYDVDIEVLDPSINEFLYTATIKNESLDQILKLIEYTSPVKCEIERTRNNKISKIYIQRNN